MYLVVVFDVFVCDVKLEVCSRVVCNFKLVFRLLVVVCDGELVFGSGAVVCDVKFIVGSKKFV